MSTTILSDGTSQSWRPVSSSSTAIPSSSEFSSIPAANYNETYTDQIGLNGAPPASANINADDSGIHDQDSFTSFHQIVKKTDFGFNLAVTQLEKFALEQAASHARAGLPRQDAPAIEELPIEATLRSRATEIFLDWNSRVDRKVQDAIHLTSISASRNLAQLRHTLAEHRAGRQRLLESIKSSDNNHQHIVTTEKTYEYGSSLKRKWYLSMVGLLVIVDWVANVPIFSELLPQEVGSEQRWQNIVDAHNRWGMWAGLGNAMARITFSPEVSLLALGVVVFLMFLGHVAGKSARLLVAFSERDDAGVMHGLKSRRRQSWIPLFASIAGVSIIVLFLFTSRGRIESLTQERLKQSDDQLSMLQATLLNANKQKNEQVILETTERLEDAKALREERNKRVIYASGISSMNFPILLLNLVLSITAAVGAYLHDSAHFVDLKITDPNIDMNRDSFRLQIDSVKGEHRIRVQSMKGLACQIEADIATVHYLSHLDPHEDWRGKARRLEGIIPLFRSENARLRGVDVQNIAVFREKWPLDLPPLEEKAAFELPQHFLATEADFERLQTEIENIYIDEGKGQS